jgi:hypothetical protein
VAPRLRQSIQNGTGNSIMDKFGIVQTIGELSCKAASHATDFLWADPACEQSQYWNMGMLVVVTVIGVLALRIIHSWRKQRHESGYL